MLLEVADQHSKAWSVDEDSTVFAVMISYAIGAAPFDCPSHVCSGARLSRGGCSAVSDPITVLIAQCAHIDLLMQGVHGTAKCL